MASEGEASNTRLPMDTVPMARRAAAFGFLLVAEFFYGWAWNSVDVLRPAIRAGLRLTLTQAGSGYSSQGAGALIGAVVIGQMADRLGRRPMLSAVMVGYGLALFAGAAVTTYPQYLLQRFVLGVAMGGIFPIVVGVYAGLFAARWRGRLASGISAVFSSAIVALGLAYGWAGEGKWRSLLVLGAIPPIVLAGLAFVVVPDERRYAPFGAGLEAPARGARLPIAELFSAGARRRTLLLATMTGLNFLAYQAFNGWFTTYLKEVRHLSAAQAGGLVAWQFAANIVGGLMWGWFGDRFGRRAAAWGFVVASGAIAGFLWAPADPTLLRLLVMACGFGISCSVVWGPWLAELYPERLRATAAGIFNWGRLVSFFAPLATGAVASRFGLTWSMLLASGVFLAAAAIWFTLPETLNRGDPDI